MKKKYFILCLILTVLLCVMGILSIFHHSSQPSEYGKLIITHETMQQTEEDLIITSDGEDELETPRMVLTNIEVLQEIFPVGVLNTLQEESGLYLKHHGIQNITTSILPDSITFYNENPSFQCFVTDTILLKATYDTNVKILRFSLEETKK